MKGARTSECLLRYVTVAKPVTYAGGPAMTAAYPITPSSDKFPCSREQFERIVSILESAEALRLSHAVLEEQLTREGRELQRRLLQEHLDLKAAAELRLVEVSGSDGSRRWQSRPLSVGLGSVFGDVQVTRLVYQSPGVRGLAPVDGLLNRPPGYHSFGIRRLVAEHAAKDSFEEVVAEVEAVTGCKVNKRQVEQLAMAAAADFDAFYTHSPIELSVLGPRALVVLSFDGKGIVMRKEDLREATRKAAEQGSRKLEKRLTKGEKRNRKRMAEVATVYGVEPFERDAEDVIRELRPARDVAQRRPKPMLKRVWASVVKGMDEVIDEAFCHARRLDPSLERHWVVVVDGNKDQIRAIRKAAKRHGVCIILIVDLMHVLEYLWKAAYCFHAEGTQQAQDWVTERLRALLLGHDPGQIAAGMRRSATRQNFAAAVRKPVDACARYLINNRRWIDYLTALHHGFPISTGVVEGACRYLVKDRMDRTGARWSLPGAEAVLRLRALRTSGDLAAYWEFHLAQELRRNHLNLYPDAQLPDPMPPTRPAKAHLRRIK